ncbi:MAG TPA: hypothetical protein VGQ76_28725 [Thermoanaerobaculia bacterium]|jgi:hypothetical protein|nr:hypothetical protein [Thermoanaerobaculia bacterium]
MHKVMFVLALVTTLPAIAQSPKKPWTLTVEERIALRTNPGLAQERVRSGRQIETSGVPTMGTEARPLVDSFDGKTHPELFLPHEIFQNFVKLAFMTNSAREPVLHRSLMSEVRRLELPADFFERLRSVSTLYISQTWTEREIGQRLQGLRGAALSNAEKALAVTQADLCRSRADALSAARTEFGRERFDRFLYEVMAVNMFSVADRLPDSELLRYAAGGCR